MTDSLPPEATAKAVAPTAYQVLARKYRPQDFSTLYGQEALVQTLTNAMESGRLAQAFMLTGVRGVGKTTTARIIARALNCERVDPQQGQVNPCGQCNSCRAILNETHADVREMDAATHTSVDDIRELIGTLAMLPVMGRRKVYIIDEVHMLSKSAFNALLKTLEEPPEQVTFIFATTEIRKVPVTVLSRCQRFDLRRLSREDLTKLFQEIADKEGVKIEAAALALLSRAADGSARDGLSLLDQAIARTQGQVSEESLISMLGLADREQLLDLLEALFDGRVLDALALLEQLHRHGSMTEPILTDLADWVHALTRLKVGDAARLSAETKSLTARLEGFAARLSVPLLGRFWVMLLNGIDEVKRAPDSMQAADMLLIRLAHLADTPPPSTLLKQLEASAEPSIAPLASKAAKETAATQEASITPATRQDSDQNQSHAHALTANRSSPETSSPAMPSPTAAAPASPPVIATKAASLTASAATSPASPSPTASPAPALVQKRSSKGGLESVQDLVNLALAQNEMLIAEGLRRDARLVSTGPRQFSFALTPRFTAQRARALTRFLSEATGEPYMVGTVEAEGAPTLIELEQEAEAAALAAAAQEPLIAAALARFPGAQVTHLIKEKEPSHAQYAATDETGPGHASQNGRSARSAGDA